ncbi:MAG: hypothetical protein CL780_03390 [Chloroflexi bacterium]|nr:hypothetical protein [Chloroflexota bacterium]
MGPNILIIIYDKLKAKTLNLYGNNDVKTPNIDRLASSRITYKNHYVSDLMYVPSCLAFWTSIRHNQVPMSSDRIHYAKLLKDSHSIPFFYNPNTFSDTVIDSSDFY